MRIRILFGLLALMGALAVVTPASAATINGVDYVLFARTEILMEISKDCDPLPADLLGCMIITGNVAVSEPTGRIRTGSHNIINGITTANNLVLASNASITECRYNVTSGAAPAVVCGTVVTPLPAGTLPIVAWPVNGGPLGAVALSAGCDVNTAADVTVAAGATLNLAPGCYRNVRVNAGGTLNLSTGVYDMRTLRMIAGSTINGAGQPATTVTVAVQAISEPGVSWNNLRVQSVNTAAFNVSESISIGSQNQFSNVLLYAPTNAIHLRSGSSATGFEAVANFLTIEPIIIIVDQEFICGCFDTVTVQGTNILLSGGQNLNLATSFVLSATCDPAGGTTVPATAVSPTTATLNASGVTGTFKVIAVFSSGSYCNNTLVTLP